MLNIMLPDKFSGHDVIGEKKCFSGLSPASLQIILVCLLLTTSFSIYFMLVETMDMLATALQS